MRDIAGSPDANIVLIGMPGVGKSTVGVLLAKALSRDFADTDLYIQSRECRRLQEILDGHGRDVFLILEERYVLTLDMQGYVIATGGSVVYSKHAMEHLAATGVIVHLELPFELLERRLSTICRHAAWLWAPGKRSAPSMTNANPSTSSMPTSPCPAKDWATKTPSLRSSSGCVTGDSPSTGFRRPIPARMPKRIWCRPKI